MPRFGGLIDAPRGKLGWLDFIVVAGLFVTLGFAPFAFGAVHRWAYTLIETAQFALLIGWMAHVRLEGAKPARSAVTRANVAGLTLPTSLFALLLAFQIVPIPPALMRVISPATYHLYTESFPGWPETAPYQALRAAWSSSPRGAPALQLILPPVGVQKPVRARAAAPAEAAKAKSAVPERPSPAKLGHFGDLRWRSISIAPSVTWASFIELFACCGFFFLILCYPFGFVGAERETNARFMRQLVLAVVAIGAAVALIGLVEKATWNGRILWFFVPQDWAAAAPEKVRASGPFVNPDHFANFLAMILPLAMVGAIFPLASVHREHATDLRTPCAVAAFLITAGIVLSLSRGAWIASTVGVCIGLGLSFNHAGDRAPALLRRLGVRTLPLMLGGFGIFLLLMLFVIGPSGRDEAASRIGATLTQGDSLGLKPSAWRDSLRMIADFPLFGVGLGCWPEIFPHYQRPPAMQFFYRQPENDYIQFLAETGLAGTLLAIWFGTMVWRKCRAAAAQLSARQWPLFAGFSAGLTAALIHEFFDFGLHTPANALLFIVLLAALLRLALTQGAESAVAGLRTVSMPSRFTYLSAAGIAASAVALMVAAQLQPDAAYPYDIGTPRTFTQAETATVDHPADSGVHLALAALMPPGAPALLRRRELQAAVWLNPNDPLARDVYARSLLLDGYKRDGLEQITLSVFHSPELESHFYLQPRAIQWLLPEEQQAVYEGFGRAIGAGYANSAQALAGFYRQLGRYFEAAEVEQKAAAATDNDATRFTYLLDAGRDYAQDGESSKAQAQFRAAIEIDPSDAAPYRDLMVEVLGPNHDLKGANAIADEAVAAGADEITIGQARADAARASGDADAAEAALIQVSKDAPNFTSMMNLGGFYRDTGKYGRATVAFQQALQIDPTSAQAYFSLAQAEEASFDFASANRDYDHALKLAPNEAGMRHAYEQFQLRLKQARKPASGG
ncbi:MAG: hypothetical protein QOG61_1473 [Candidatus Binataceae bacterium]|nr:hypothetical protein [Candidatus Binataceae bacterium]